MESLIFSSPANATEHDAKAVAGSHASEFRFVCKVMLKYLTSLDP